MIVKELLQILLNQLNETNTHESVKRIWRNELTQIEYLKNIINSMKTYYLLIEKNPNVLFDCYDFHLELNNENKYRLKLLIGKDNKIGDKIELHINNKLFIGRNINDKNLQVLENFIDFIENNYNKRKKKVILNINFFLHANDKLDSLLSKYGYKNMIFRTIYEKDFDKLTNIKLSYKKGKYYFRCKFDLLNNNLSISDNDMYINEKGLGFQIMLILLKSLIGKRFKVNLPNTNFYKKLKQKYPDANIILK